jgi:hypothetical protein
MLMITFQLFYAGIDGVKAVLNSRQQWFGSTTHLLIKRI